jgi:hypothetical protein
VSPAEKILVIDRGHAELAYPAAWNADPDPGGHLRLIDPTRTCRLEVSYLRLPPVPRDALPSLETQVRLVLADVPAARAAPVHTEDRGDAWLAWSDYETDPPEDDDPPHDEADDEADPAAADGWEAASVDEELEPLPLEATAAEGAGEAAGEPKARTRLLLISNGRFQALLTFNYLERNADWAIPAWTRIVATTRLGDGSQLARPEDHWSMRDRA